MKVICEVYKSNKKSDCYLYVDKRDGLQRVPETLLLQFGEPVKVMTLVLTPDKKLARADAKQVLKQLDKEGYYLQLPPSPFVKGTV